MPDPSAKAASRAPLFFYNLLFPLVFLGLLPGLARRMIRRGNYRHKFGQRFAHYDEPTRRRLAAVERPIWVHSISVGETLVALKLIRKMRELQPGLRVVLSATTSTGFALAEENASDWLEAIYNPIDALPFARRALGAVRPSRLIFVEAIWPNLLAQAVARGIPTGLIARLSPRSEARFRRFRLLSGPVFRLLDVISVQEPEDIPRWQSLGADPRQIRVAGNIKFDAASAGPGREAEFRAALARLSVPADAPILLGGSTFPGEEGMLARICASLRAEFPGLFLIVAPRHVERANEAAAEITAARLTFSLRTGEPHRAQPPDCLLVNTTGELRDWYRLATVVYIGKSMSPAATGGQNPVEPVFAGRPVTFGPHMENFRAIVSRLLGAEAAVEAATPAELEAAIAALLREPLRREAIARRAREIVAPQEGATERNARLFSGEK